MSRLLVSLAPDPDCVLLLRHSEAVLKIVLLDSALTVYRKVARARGAGLIRAKALITKLPLFVAENWYALVVTRQNTVLKFSARI
jgi:hypothetical protein